MTKELEELTRELWSAIWVDRGRLERIEAVLLTLADKSAGEPITGKDIENALREEGVID